MPTTKISVNVSFEFYYWLEKAAKSQDRRISDIVREALEEYRERQYSLRTPPMTDAALEQLNAVVASLQEQDRAAAEKAANG